MNKKRFLPRGQVRPGVVKVTGSAGHKSTAMRLIVPQAIAKLIDPESIFQVELTDEGILYRYIGGGKPVVPELPKWVTDGD